MDTIYRGSTDTPTRERAAHTSTDTDTTILLIQSSTMSGGSR